MASKVLSFPVKKLGSDDWFDLTAHGLAHEFVGEIVKARGNLSFAGGHRVRLYFFKKNVHWRPSTGGLELDIEDVKPSGPPRRSNR